MFHQALTPVGGSLTLSFLVALLPIAAVLLLLGVLRRPAWEASVVGLALGLLIATAVWRLPLRIALAAASDGAVFALWPVMWIVVNALLFYNITVASGRFDAFRSWMIAYLPNDRRVLLIVVAFCFGALLEGICGFGAPVAITASLLILCGFAPLEALVFVLIFNTTPVAFGALGTPVTVLGAVTGLPARALAEMVGRQLPVMAALLPFYVTLLYGGWRSIAALWPVLLVAGSSFGIAQFVASNYLDYTLTDVLAALVSLAVTLSFLRRWQPRPAAEFMLSIGTEAAATRPVGAAAWRGWTPWLVLTATVILWTFFKIGNVGQHSIPWPYLDKRVVITLYDDKVYAATWVFQPLGTGTAILAGALLTALLVRLPLAAVVRCALLTVRQIWQAVLTVMAILGLAYVMNYSGLAYTLGLAVASTGPLFIVFSPFLGWVAVFLSGSDTSGNALFGNLQVIAARQLHLNPLLFAATNSSGGVLGKMISPQNIATGVSVTNLKGQEGAVLARTFLHSVVLTLLLVLIVIVQEYWLPAMIPRLVSGP
jgi:lactate permease